MAAKMRKPKSLRPTDRPMPVVSTAVAINVSGVCLERVVLQAIMDISAHSS
jgi:hypothetical protein